MSKISFTDLTVKALPLGTHFDSKIPGFGIRVGKNRRTWLVVKGPRAKRVQTILGYYPALSLQDARRRAHGELGTQVQEKTAPTFPVARTAYLAQGKWRPKSKVALESSLKHFTWSKAIDKITHEDVDQALAHIEAPSARAHAFKDLRAFFNWTVPRYLTHSPCRGMKMVKQPSRSRILTNDELRRVWKACERLSRYGAIVKLLMLTGQRRGEIAKIQPFMVQEKSVTFPIWLTKNGREHTWPLGKAAAEIIASAQFVGHETFNDWQRQKTNLDKASGVTGWTVHDLRRTFASGLASLGTPIHITEKLLNHVSGTTGGLVGVYQRHEYWPEQVAAIQAWEERVHSLVR